MKYIVLGGLAAILFFLSGCSGEGVSAKVTMWKAEELFTKAYRLKFKKVPSEERIAIYRESCLYFFKAFEKDARLFTLNRIWSAQEACKWAEDEEKADQFTDFEEAYTKEHPIEDEHGDDMPIMF